MVESLGTTSPEKPLALWRIPLDRDVTVDDDWLSDEEKSFAGGFRDVLLRGRFLAARRGVRRVLGAETGVRPRDLRFANAEHGKPFLDDPSCGLEFNLTHTENVALLAVSRGGPVGVDIESIERKTDVDQLAPRVMTRAEHAAFLALESDDRPGAFFHLWTAKEALLKVTGFGLGIDPRKVETEPLLAVDGRVRFRSDDSRLVAADWMAMRLQVDAPYIAFLAIGASNDHAAPGIRDLPALELPSSGY